MAMSRLHQAPRIFYNPLDRNPDGGMGAWVPTRAEDLRFILQNTEIFSSHQIARYSSLLGESWPLIPAEVDPPAHGAYRKILNPLFSPPVIKELEPRIRQHAVNLISAIADKGECDFVDAFAKPFPILIFLSVMGLPLDAFDDIVRWGHDLHGGTTMEQRARGATAIGVFLRDQIRAVKETPRNDVISKIVHSLIDGRPLTDDETIGIVYLVFAGGIHTVTASLGFQCLHLAERPALQTELRSDPSRIPSAIEEMLRTYAVVQSYRRVVQDVELGGASMRKGDWVLNALPVGNFDPAEFPEADQFHAARKPNRHMTFSFGPHFCLGAHLARVEMGIAWSEWLTRLPEFRLMADLSASADISSGTLLGVNRLLVAWN
jgi:cytochrome P450